MAKVSIKTCSKCGIQRSLSAFTTVPNPFFGDNLFPICNDCLGEMLQAADYSLTIGNRLCQCANVPFKPGDWVGIANNHKQRTFTVYVSMFKAGEYESVNWEDLNEKWVKLEKEKKLEESMPQFQEEKIKELRAKWGEQYLPEDLNYLERLYQGIMNTQNVNGSLQLDQALKLCKLSLIIDKKIRAEEEFDKMLKSYDSLAKLADFTPKNLKNTNDFETSGELWGYIEKTGWMNPFYQGEQNDIVDLTMKEIQIYNRSLYINETGIDEEIKDRISALQVADELDRSTEFFDNNETDLDETEAAAYELEDFSEDAGL